LSTEINTLGYVPLQPEFVLGRERNEEKNRPRSVWSGSHLSHTNNEASHTSIGGHDFLQNFPTVAQKPRKFKVRTFTIWRIYHK